MDKKQQQLGMNPSTASNRLVKDLLFKFAVQAGCVCHRCKQPLTRESFSIDHVEPWMDSDDPVGLFFDLSNIAFSHHGCNVGAGRKPHKKYASFEEKRKAGWDRHREVHGYDPEKRRQQYLRTGT